MPPGPRLRIIGVNDVYRLDHLPRLGTLIAELGRTDPVERTLVTLAGDFLAPSLLSSIDHGRGMVAMLNALGVTHVTFGNHEDDLEPAHLVARVDELEACWLASNVVGFARALPTHDVITVGGANGRAFTVGLIGVVSEAASLYRHAPFGGATLLPARARARALARQLHDEGCAAIVALTHLSVAEDRQLASEQRDPPLSLILGGHDHQPLLETIDGTLIAKSGSDAALAIVAELAFADDDDATATPPRVTARLERVTDRPPDPALAALAAHHLAAVADLQRAALYRIPPGEALSSIGARRQQTSLGTLLTSAVRDTLGADACVINGGGLRGARSYEGCFTFGDLESELPFDNEVVVVTLGGRELAAAIAASRARAPTEESGGFLQIDDGLGLAADTRTLLTVRGAPLDPEGRYRVALMRELLLGMDHIAPLEAIGRDTPERVPFVGLGRETKLIVVEAFGAILAARMGGLAALDRDGDGTLSVAEIAAGIDCERG